jgi:hypothetical protein
VGNPPPWHADRAACVWLIRRFIDEEAEFLFVDTRVLPPDEEVE